MALSAVRLQAGFVSIGVLAVSALAPATAASRVDLPFKDLEGRKVRLKDLRGKPAVVNFWATWCGPCRAEMPMFVEMEKVYGPRGITFVAVSLDDRTTRPKIPAFIEEFKIAFPVWTGGSTMDLGDLKLGTGLPATVFLDAEGHIVARVLGQVRKEELKERIEWLAGGERGPAPAPLVRHFGGD